MTDPMDLDSNSSGMIFDGFTPFAPVSRGKQTNYSIRVTKERIKETRRRYLRRREDPISGPDFGAPDFVPGLVTRPPADNPERRETWHNFWHLLPNELKDEAAEEAMAAHGRMVFAYAEAEHHSHHPQCIQTRDPYTRVSCDCPRITEEVSLLPWQRCQDYITGYDGLNLTPWQPSSTLAWLHRYGKTNNSLLEGPGSVSHNFRNVALRFQARIMAQGGAFPRMRESQLSLNPNGRGRNHDEDYLESRPGTLQTDQDVLMLSFDQELGLRITGLNHPNYPRNTDMWAKDFWQDVPRVAFDMEDWILNLSTDMEHRGFRSLVRHMASEGSYEMMRDNTADQIRSLNVNWQDAMWENDPEWQMEQDQPFPADSAPLACTSNFHFDSGMDLLASILRGVKEVWFVLSINLVPPATPMKVATDGQPRARDAIDFHMSQYLQSGQKYKDRHGNAYCPMCLYPHPGRPEILDGLDGHCFVEIRACSPYIDYPTARLRQASVLNDAAQKLSIPETFLQARGTVNQIYQNHIFNTCLGEAVDLDDPQYASNPDRPAPLPELLNLRRRSEAIQTRDWIITNWPTENSLNPPAPYPRPPPKFGFFALAPREWIDNCAKANVPIPPVPQTDAERVYYIDEDYQSSVTISHPNMTIKRTPPPEDHLYSSLPHEKLTLFDQPRQLHPAERTDFIPKISRYALNSAHRIFDRNMAFSSVNRAAMKEANERIEELRRVAGRDEEWVRLVKGEFRRERRSRDGSRLWNGDGDEGWFFPGGYDAATDGIV